jgi:hypothetical protein
MHPQVSKVLIIRFRIEGFNCVLELGLVLFYVHVGKGQELSKQFKRKLSPCCESFDSNGYCGQQSESSELLYSVCNKSNKFFYWDDMHPTHAGWEAVMKQLEKPLRDFVAQD